MEFKSEYFTDEELELLRMAFALVDTVVETARVDNYDVRYANALYDLKQKLGISDLVD